MWATDLTREKRSQESWLYISNIKWKHNVNKSNSWSWNFNKYLRLRKLNVISKWRLFKDPVKWESKIHAMEETMWYALVGEEPQNCHKDIRSSHREQSLLSMELLQVCIFSPTCSSFPQRLQADGLPATPLGICQTKIITYSTLSFYLIEFSLHIHLIQSYKENI